MPKTSIKPKTHREKTNFKLITMSKKSIHNLFRQLFILLLLDSCNYSEINAKPINSINSASLISIEKAKYLILQCDYVLHYDYKDKEKLDKVCLFIFKEKYTGTIENGKYFYKIKTKKALYSVHSIDLPTVKISEILF